MSEINEAERRYEWPKVERPLYYDNFQNEDYVETMWVHENLDSKSLDFLTLPLQVLYILWLAVKDQDQTGSELC